MSDVRILDYVKNVEMNRQRLLQHCKNNNVAIDETSSLNNVVSTVSTINNPAPEAEETYEVLYIDIDGTVLQRTEVHSGDPVPAPPANPNYDPEYLEFKGWSKTKGYETLDGVDTVLHDIDIGAIYDTKPLIIEDTVVHPTIIKTLVSETIFSNLTISNLQIKTTNTNKNVYVDWGDGTIDQKNTGTSKSAQFPHTYQDIGEYVIKIYSTDVWEINAAGHFLRDNKGITHIYVGTGFNRLPSYGIYQMCNLEILSLSPSVEYISTFSIFTCPKLKAAILPEYVEGCEMFEGVSSAQFLIIPKTYHSALPIYLPEYNSNKSDYPLSLRRLILPDLSYISDTSSMAYLYSLETLYLPNTGTTPSVRITEAPILKRLIVPARESISVNNINIVGDLNKVFDISGSFKTLTLSQFGVRTKQPFIIPDSVKTLSISSPSNVLELTLPAQLEKFTYSPSSYGGYVYNLPTTLQLLSVSRLLLHYPYIETTDIMHTCEVQYMPNLKELIVNKNTTTIIAPTLCPKLEKLIYNCSADIITSTFTLTNCIGLKTLQLPKNINVSINFGYQTGINLSKESTIELAKSLKDRQGLSALTLTIPYALFIQMEMTYVDQEGNLTDKTNANAITVLEFIKNKNWTISPKS